jgi:gluconate 2-dehydrogenase gamma chain
MTKQEFDRRDFLKGAVVGGAAAASATAAIAPAETAQAQPSPPAAGPTTPEAAGYEFLNLVEAAFIEALVDHMVPADALTPKGTDLGINIYIDRALAGAWGKGERLSYNPTGPVGALAYWTADAIKNRYVKNPGPLVPA